MQNNEWWSTTAELRFIAAHVGTHLAKNSTMTALEAEELGLENYIKAAYRRHNWEGLDRVACISAAENRLKRVREAKRKYQEAPSSGVGASRKSERIRGGAIRSERKGGVSLKRSSQTKPFGWYRQTKLNARRALVNHFFFGSYIAVCGKASKRDDAQVADRRCAACVSFLKQAGLEEWAS